MKKTLALLLAAVMLLSVLAACSSKAETPAEPEQTTEEPAQTPDAPAEETTEETTAAEEPSQEELDQCRPLSKAVHEFCAERWNMTYEETLGSTQ